MAAPFDPRMSAPSNVPASAPVQNTPPPIDDDSTVSSSDDGDITITAPTTPAATPTETPPAPKAVFEMPAPTAKPAAPVDPSTAAKRDYSQFPEPVAEILKHLPNALFDKYGAELPKWQQALIKQAELEKQLADAKAAAPPAYYHEHPDAYRLMPEYTEATQKHNFAQFEADHWRRQLELIESGDEWFELKGYENGQPVFERHEPLEDGKVDIRAKVAVQGAMLTAQSNIQRHSQTIAGIIQQSRNGHTVAMQEIAEIEKKIFPALDESKYTPQEQEWAKLVSQAAPRVFQNHPLVTRLLSKSFVAYMRLLNQYTKERAEWAKTSSLAEKSRLAGTTPPPSAGKSSEEDDVVKESDFE